MRRRIIGLHVVVQLSVFVMVASSAWRHLDVQTTAKGVKIAFAICDIVAVLYRVHRPVREIGNRVIVSLILRSSFAAGCVPVNCRDVEMPVGARGAGDRGDIVLYAPSW